MSNKKVLDLFCGCGGLSYGFELAGYEILLGIDSNSWATKSFEKNHKNSKTLCGDIEKITAETIKKTIGDSEIDVFVGGPPCQGLSLSGPRKYDDPRNRLFLSYVRLAKELKPKAFVLENVPSLATLYKGRIKDEIVKEFTNLGYKVSYQVLHAADYGVPQTRKRIFFVGLLDSTKNFTFPIPTHNAKKDSNKLDNVPYITCHEALCDLPDLHDIHEEEAGYYTSSPQNDYQKIMRNKVKDSYENHVITKHKEHVKKIISMVPQGGNFKDLPEEYRGTRNFNVAWTRYHGEKPAPTIDTGHRHHFHYKLNRVPTVRESARLQSFPDDFVFTGSKTEQYKQVGNAVPPLLAQAIAEELKKVL